MEIFPAPVGMSTFTTTRDGKMVGVEDDVLNVVRDLKQIDPHLCVRFSEAGGYFVVYWKPEGEEDGNGELVLTAQELDQRIVNRVRYLISETYDYVAEIKRLDAEAEKEREREFTEKVGDIGERLAHALRKDLGAGNRAFVGKGLNGKS